MKKATLAVIVVLLALSAADVFAQTTAIATPSSLTGFVYGHFEDDSVRDSKLSRLRVRVNLVPAKNSCVGGRIETDLIDTKYSYLHQAWVACNMSGWTVKTGRLFLAALTQSPAPSMIKTAKYPTSWTYAAYAYGAQVDRPLGGGWRMSADLTGRSGLKYNDGHLFSRLESSGRIVREDGSWSYGGAYQVSRNFQRVGLDVEKRIGKFSANALVAYTTERKHVEGFVFADYRLYEWLRPHVQIDRAKGETNRLVGVGVYAKKHAYFVIEHDGREFLARLQLMIKR